MNTNFFLSIFLLWACLFVQTGMAETNVSDSAPFPPEVMDFIESMGTNDVSDEQMAEMFKLIL